MPVLLQLVRRCDSLDRHAIDAGDVVIAEPLTISLADQDIKVDVIARRGGADHHIAGQ